MASARKGTTWSSGHATTWTELQAVWGLHHRRVTSAVYLIRTRLLFRLREWHSDNGSAFINACLLAWCRRDSIHFTRGRPYRKNDQACGPAENRRRPLAPNPVWTAVTEIVTHSPRQAAIGRNPARRHVRAVESATHRKDERRRPLNARTVNPEVAGSIPVEPAISTTYRHRAPG